MKLALIGKDISHSKSPHLYRDLIKTEFEYDLLDFPNANELPVLDELARKYDAINITSPYKEHYIAQVKILDKTVQQLGAINTIKLQTPYLASNTDLLAVRTILMRFQQQLGELHLALLGSGVMARLTLLVAKELGLNIQQFCRSKGDDVQYLDLSHLQQPNTIIINACSRKFSFQGKLHSQQIFWDYNYHFIPHQNTIPKQVKTYYDGLEILRLQAQAAVEFWQNN